MRVVSSLLSFAVTLLLTQQTTPSLPTPAPASDPQAISLLQQCAKSLGPTSGVQDIAMSGTMTRTMNENTQVPFSYQTKGYSQLRQEITFADHSEILLVSGGQGSFNSAGVARQPLPVWVTYYQRPDFFPALICNAEITRSDTVIFYLGVETVAAGSVHHIVISAAPLGKNPDVDADQTAISAFHVYLDTQTLRVVATKHFVFSPDTSANRSDWQTFYSDYRSVGSILVPYHMECFIAGQKYFMIDLTTTTVNNGLSDSEFSQP